MPGEVASAAGGGRSKRNEAQKQGEMRTAESRATMFQEGLRSNEIPSAPATISKNLLTGLLRNKLGFEGIIISDATNMSGFCSYTNLYRAAALFLEAGGDCLLFKYANNEFFKEMKKQIEAGILKIETLKNRAIRMRSFARQYFETHEAPISDDKALADCCKKITKGSIEVLRDRANVLPIKIEKGTKIAHMVLCNLGANQADAAPAALTKELEKAGATVDVLCDPGPGVMLNSVKNNNYDYIICSVVNEMSYGLNTVKLSGTLARNMMNGWMRYGTPAIFISNFDPYFAYDYNALTDTVINTYGMGDYTAEAIIEKICK